MTNNKYYKAYIEKAIALEPVEITITRTTKVDNGYKGYTTNTQVLDPQTVRLYQPRNKQVNIQTKGEQVGVGRINEKILAKGDADIQEGDRFQIANTKYRVGHVRAYFDICKQVEIEATAHED